MRVLQLSLTELAGMPSRLFRALHATGTPCRLVTYREGMFTSDIVAPDRATLEAQIDAADVVHVHGMVTYDAVAPLLAGRAHVVHIHGDPDRQRGVAPPAPHVVSTPDLLDVFPAARFVPNLILPDELPLSAPLRPGEPLRIFKSPSLHDKHGALFAALLAPIQRRLGDRVRYVAPRALMPHAELTALRQSCHVSLDHLHGYYGLESLESLAQGLIAVNGADARCLDAVQAAVGERPPFAVARDPAEVGHLLLDLCQQALCDGARFAAQRARNVAFIAERYTPAALLAPWLAIYRELV
ncbi:MAG: hypothetical protein KC503_42835 [Myxococcales bacterium]|nr:hypothetical protein [Myxococcales bacterium]